MNRKFTHIQPAELLLAAEDLERDASVRASPAFWVTPNQSRYIIPAARPPRTTSGFVVVVTVRHSGLDRRFSAAIPQCVSATPMRVHELARSTSVGLVCDLRRRSDSKRTEALDEMTRGLKDFIAEWRRERPDVNLSAFSIAAAIKQIDQQTEAEFRRVSASLGIGPGDLRVLFALRRSGVDNPRRPTDLFQSLLVTSGAVTKQLDRLEAQGFVDRLADPADQRSFLIHLTRRGAKVADAAIEAICSEQTTIGAAIASLSEEERAAGDRFLQRLLAAFEAIAGDAVEAPALAPTPRRR